MAVQGEKWEHGRAVTMWLVTPHGTVSKSRATQSFPWKQHFPRQENTPARVVDLAALWGHKCSPSTFSERGSENDLSVC